MDDLLVGDDAAERLLWIRSWACPSANSLDNESTIFANNGTDRKRLFYVFNETYDISRLPVNNTSKVHFRYVEELLYTRVIVTICAFGLIGNIGNLFILVPQGRHCSMGRIERFAYWGLVSLSVSDACFCLLVLPHVWAERDPYSYHSLSFSLLYSTYGAAMLNVFTMGSTWLTVMMAVGRYLAICYPFKARELIGRTIAKRAGFFVYAACIAFNVPRFLNHSIERIDCPIIYLDRLEDEQEGDDRQVGGETFYFRWPGYAHVKTNPQFEYVYNWLYFTFGISIPFVFLVVSNFFLVRALSRARNKLRLIRAVEVCSVDQYRPITLTLVILVMLHIILVTPAEFVMFLRQQLSVDIQEDDKYNLLAAVGNTLQAVNFSINFVLYYTINVHFRRAMGALVHCRSKRCCSGRSSCPPSPSPSSSRASRRCGEFCEYYTGLSGGGRGGIGSGRDYTKHSLGGAAGGGGYSGVSVALYTYHPSRSSYIGHTAAAAAHGWLGDRREEERMGQKRKAETRKASVRDEFEESGGNCAENETNFVNIHCESSWHI